MMTQYSQLAPGSAPGAARPPRRLLAGAACSALTIALMTTGCSSASPHAGAPAGTPGAAAGPVWVCRPGQAANPCAANLAATTVTAGGTLQPASWPHSAMASKFACFYVHGSDGLTGTGNASLAVTTVDISVAEEQGAPFSQVCQVWAPSYRSATLPTVEKGIAGDQACCDRPPPSPTTACFPPGSGSSPIPAASRSSSSETRRARRSSSTSSPPSSTTNRPYCAASSSRSSSAGTSRSLRARRPAPPSPRSRCAPPAPRRVRDRLLVVSLAAIAGLDVRPAGPGREPPVRPNGQGRPAGRLRQPGGPQRRHRQPRPLPAHPPRPPRSRATSG